MTNSAHRLNYPRSVSRKEGDKVYSVLDLLGKSLRRGIFNPINGRDTNGVPRRSTDFKSDSSESAFAEFTIRNFESVSDHMLSFRRLLFGIDHSGVLLKLPSPGCLTYGMSILSDPRP
jgi:hypothetical protein